MIEEMGGRKFVATIAGLILVAVIPPLYHYCQISDTITQVVLASVAAGVGSFGVTNALATKWASGTEKKPEAPK